MAANVLQTSITNFVADAQGGIWVIFGNWESGERHVRVARPWIPASAGMEAK